jgi:glyoxylase-like metal-dependent hydrolase (beta-lactamase superfamily II)
MYRMPRTMAPGIYGLDAIGIPEAISVLLIREEDGWTLVDTGLGSSPKRIQSALASLGADAGKLKRIFITHQHDDHVGGLRGILEFAPEAEVSASAHEAAVISGERGFDPQSNRFMRYMARNARPPGIEVGRIVEEGDLVAGFRVISTPGHTLGHVSLLHDEHKLLFTADAFGALPFKLRVGVIRAFCTDPGLAKRSAEKLLDEEFENVYFSHGRPLLYAEGDPRTRLRGTVADCRY